MAYKTLAELRADLNDDLFLADDDDNRFGTASQRNKYLQTAFRKLWPQMARLVSEEIVIESGVAEYQPSEIRDIELIENVDTDGIVKGSTRSWRNHVIEDSDSPTLRLMLPNLNAGWTVRLTGYAPYIIPASDTSRCDLPNELTHVVITGARAEAYRARINAFVDYEQRAVANPTTQITAAELSTLYQMADREFRELRALHQRSYSGAKRAIPRL